MKDDTWASKKGDEEGMEDAASETYHDGLGVDAAEEVWFDVAGPDADTGVDPDDIAVNTAVNPTMTSSCVDADGEGLGQTDNVVVGIGNRTIVENKSSSTGDTEHAAKPTITMDEAIEGVASKKGFVINKAATAGQATLCPAVFGRGTDFFCRDETVQKNGGVHIIQTFLSAELSEEVQIQGRTGRQGKEGSYQLVLLERDLCDDFGVAPGDREKIPREERYKWLCQIREKRQEQQWKNVEENLKIASVRDTATHKYFDSLLDGNESEANKNFEDLYSMIKIPKLPESITADIAFVVDITASMSVHCNHALSVIRSLIEGGKSIASKLGHTFPDTKLKIRVGVLGYRDIDDGENQFAESVWDGGGHFTESVADMMACLEKIISQPSGGNDLAEDHFGAIHRCMNWSGPSDWSSSIKMMLLLTDAPAHGCAPPASISVPNIDHFAERHPRGMTAFSVCDELITKGVNFFLCSYNTLATSITEKKLAEEYLKHPKNVRRREVVGISMVSQDSGNASKAGQSLIGDHQRHIVFVLDESQSMENDWWGVVTAYQTYIDARRQNQTDSDLVSVVQFNHGARVTIECTPIGSASRSLDYKMGGRKFAPAASTTVPLIKSTPISHRPTVVFMSAGEANDSAQAASIFAAVNQDVQSKHGCGLELHVIAFGGGADTRQLEDIARSSPNGRVHCTADIPSLCKVFIGHAGGDEVVTAVHNAIAEEISETATDTRSLEYLS